MLEAKRFEKELEARTEHEYAQKKAQNDEKIHSECKRIERFISALMRFAVFCERRITIWVRKLRNKNPNSTLF